VTLEVATAAVQMEEILAALDSLEDTHIIFTMPNADMEGRALFDLIQDFVVDRPQCSVYTSLGQLRYLSTVAQVDAVVGNSSSGLTEVPSLGIGTVNIGDRQRGRLKAASVVDCDPDRQSISAALAHIQTEEFRSVLATSRNPYDPFGDGQTSRRVLEVLRTVDLGGVLKKRFHDLPVA
jgi:GDP/UDP-N,N'-diacetylbacillosamine 2-epimerase (hydrolysing)